MIVAKKTVELVTGFILSASAKNRNPANMAVLTTYPI